MPHEVDDDTQDNGDLHSSRKDLGSEEEERQEGDEEADADALEKRVIVPCAGCHGDVSREFQKEQGHGAPESPATASSWPVIPLIHCSSSARWCSSSSAHEGG